VDGSGTGYLLVNTHGFTTLKTAVFVEHGEGECEAKESCGCGGRQEWGSRARLRALNEGMTTAPPPKVNNNNDDDSSPLPFLARSSLSTPPLHSFFSFLTAPSISATPKLRVLNPPHTYIHEVFFFTPFHYSTAVLSQPPPFPSLTQITVRPRQSLAIPTLSRANKHNSADFCVLHSRAACATWPLGHTVM
jgi:hypothetical protein